MGSVCFFVLVCPCRHIFLSSFFAVVVTTSSFENCPVAGAEFCLSTLANPRNLKIPWKVPGKLPRLPLPADPQDTWTLLIRLLRGGESATSLRYSVVCAPGTPVVQGWSFVLRDAREKKYFRLATPEIHGRGCVCCLPCLCKGFSSRAVVNRCGA